MKSNESSCFHKMSLQKKQPMIIENHVAKRVESATGIQRSIQSPF